MKLNREQQLKVEENMGLVGRVIKDRVHGIGQSGMMDYDDLFQIGCIGLCKAAASDKGTGAFSTYAYRLIWHEICDQLIKQNRTSGREQLREADAISVSSERVIIDPAERFEIKSLLQAATDHPGEVIGQGIRALRLSADGYTSREVGEMMSAQPGTVRMWMTKARRYMQVQSEIQAVMCA